MRTRKCRDKDVQTYPQPIGALGAEAKTLETQTNAGLAVVVFVGTLVTFFATNPVSLMSAI